MQKIERDSFGRITSNEIGTERAREMAKARWEKADGRKIESAGTLLEQAGYGTPEEAPEHLRLLARLASSEKAGSVAALSAFLKLTGKAEAVTGDLQMGTDGRCPVCGCTPVSGLQIGLNDLAALLNAIHARQAELATGNTQALAQVAAP